ncbi:vWA domain-containing protein [Xylanimonas protaetiae]|uniref:VWA domain-containing protein n=1 Tax=Xylanimonas protaetiae TaxID=2509457 RepID=A0A4P6F1W7_9MICO|nr:vWA domain-containing protein [Xylanimonas protaetiae]QAY69810.1 VWA domain-containing protein [Xylanimonas protaetiae]
MTALALTLVSGGLFVTSAAADDADPTAVAVESAEVTAPVEPAPDDEVRDDEAATMPDGTSDGSSPADDGDGDGDEDGRSVDMQAGTSARAHAPPAAQDGFVEIETALTHAPPAYAPAAAEALPVADPVYAHIRVDAGADRTGLSAWSTGRLPLDEVTGLAGVVLRLHRATGASAAGTVDAPVDYDWARAVTDANGVATFRVPIVTGLSCTQAVGSTLAGSQNSIPANSTDRACFDESGAFANARFWVIQEGFEATDGATVDATNDWFMNQTLRTGATGPSPSDAFQYRFLTAAISSNQTAANPQASGVDFMHQESTSTDNLRLRSGGVWQNSRQNPSLPAQCGLNVALVMDLSSSMTVAGSPNQVPLMLDAADGLVQSLVGTPTRISAYNFGWNSPISGSHANVSGDANGPARSIASQVDATKFKAAYRSWATRSGTHATNWDQALWTVHQQNAKRAAADTYDLVVFMTDGNPTAYGLLGTSTSTTNGRGSQNARIDVEAAVFAANALKASGTRILAAGVGTAVTDAASVHNLTAISGQTQFAAGTSLGDADVFRSNDWSALRAALRDFAVESCTPSLSINKIEVPADFDASTISFDADGRPLVNGGQPGAGWSFSAVPADDAPFKVAGSGPFVTNASGSVNIPLDVSPQANQTDPGRISISEELKPGWEIVPQDGHNASCIYTTVGAGGFTRIGVMDTGFGTANPGADLSMIGESMVTCWVVNRAPAPLTASATAVGQYDTGWSWELDKSSMDDGKTVTLVPGTALPVTYTLDVAATPTNANFTASGEVVVSNPNGDAMPLDGVQVLVNGVAVELSGPTQVGAETSVALRWERTFGSTDPRPLNVLVTIDGVDQPGTVGTFTGLERNRTAVLADAFADAVLERFPLLADHFDDITLDVDGWRDQEGAVTAAGTPTWQFVYERKLGPLNAGETFEFTNVAILTPEDGDPIVDETTTTLVTREDLAVTADVTVEAQRTFDWSIEKLVRLAGSNGVWGPSAGPVVAGADGTREFEYRLVVTPGPISDSSFVATFDGIEVTNPNPVDVKLTSITPTVTIDDAVSQTFQVNEPGPWVVPAATKSGDGVTTAGVATFAVESVVVDADTVDALRAGDFRFDVEIAWDGGELGSPASSATATAPDDVEVTWEWSFTNHVVHVFDDMTNPDEPVYLGTVHWMDGVTSVAAGVAVAEPGWTGSGAERHAVFTYTLDAGVGEHLNVTWLQTPVDGEDAPESEGPPAAEDGTPDTDNPWVDDALVVVEAGLVAAIPVIDGTNHVDYDWAITKTVTSDDDVETVAGEDVEFAYLLTVTSERQVENLYVSGEVTLTNPSSGAIDVDSVVVMVGGVEATLDGVVTAVPARGPDGVGSARIGFTATLPGTLVDSDLPLPVVATVVSLPDGQPATETAETELGADDVERTVTNQTAEVRDSFPEFAEQFGDEKGEVWLDAAEADRWEFAYTANRGATVPDGGAEAFPNVATVVPDLGTPPTDEWEDDQPEGDLEDTAVVIVRTPVVYDLALRSWVSELYRPGVGVISTRFEVAERPGAPAAPVPFVTYDNPDADVQVGDIIISTVRVFNQGNRTARVDRMVKYMYPGLELTSSAAVPGHDDTLAEWEIGDSGDAYLSFDEGIVLAPGQYQTMHAFQRVTSELQDDDTLEDQFDDAGRPFREVRTFTEIAAFSGWVHEEPVVTEQVVAPVAFAFSDGVGMTSRAEATPLAEVHDGVLGSWVESTPGGLVEDVDSVPGTADHRVPFDAVSVRWVDMEINQSVGEQDEDDHDGTTIRVMSAVYVPGETPDPTPPAPATPAPTLPGVSAETGGTALGGNGWVLAALGGLGLTALVSLMVLRRREVASRD